MTPPASPAPTVAEDYVRQAQAMIDAHPLFDVPVSEWFTVCGGLLLHIYALDARLQAAEARGRAPQEEEPTQAQMVAADRITLALMKAHNCTPSFLEMEVGRACYAAGELARGRAPETPEEPR